MFNINILISEFKENQKYLKNNYFSYITSFRNMRNNETLLLYIQELNSTKYYIKIVITI